MEHNMDYNRSMTRMESRSGEIRVSIPNKKAPSFYFILESELGHNAKTDTLRVRWVSQDRSHDLFSAVSTRLRFIIDQDQVLNLTPRSMPRRIGYNINDHSSAEEAVFNISRDNLKKLAFAKSVDVELTGNEITITGFFTKYHTFPAFKKFIKNS